MTFEQASRIMRLRKAIGKRKASKIESDEEEEMPALDGSDSEEELIEDI